MNKQQNLLSSRYFGLQRILCSVLTSIILKISSFGRLTLKENKSVSSESILSVHIPITKFIFSKEFLTGISILLLSAFCYIESLSKVKIEWILG